MWKIIVCSIICMAAFAPASHASSLDEDPFVFDTEFHGGIPYADRFGGSDADTKDQHGRKLLRLDNGDVVVAGLVQAVGATQNQANGSFNIGLVRYDAAGQRVAWSNPTMQYAHSSKQYLVYPNTTMAGYRAIVDLKERNGRIYVAAKQYFSSDTTHIQLLVFGLDGSFIANYSSSAFSDFVDSGGLVFYRDGAGGADKMILAYTSYQSGAVSVSLRRFTLTVGGMQADPMFGSNGAVDLPVKGCVSPANTPVDCAATVHGVAASYGTGTPTSGVKPKIYIGGDYQRFFLSDKGWDLMVMKVDVEGALQTDYGIAGIARVAFDVSTGPTQDDRARGIALETRVIPIGQILTYKDYVYVAAAVDKKCHAGIGVAALDHGGQLRADFGDGGKRVFGGANGPFCPAGALDTPRALTRNGDRLAIVGKSTFCPGVCLAGSADDPMLAIVRTSDGALTEWRDHPVRASDGTRLGGGQFFDVVAGADGTFTAAGSLRDAGNDRRYMLQTIRLRADRIFGDGFE